MLMLPPSVRIYLAAEPVNMNKSFDGLMAQVQIHLDEDPFSGHYFVFVNRRRDRVKILFWARGGFSIYYRRLERGTFKFPSADAAHVELDAGELGLLMEGFDLAGVRRQCRWEPQRVAHPA